MKNILDEYLELFEELNVEREKLYGEHANMSEFYDKEVSVVKAFIHDYNHGALGEDLDDLGIKLEILDRDCPIINIIIGEDYENNYIKTFYVYINDIEWTEEEAKELYKFIQDIDGFSLIRKELKECNTRQELEFIKEDIDNYYKCIKWLIDIADPELESEIKALIEEAEERIEEKKKSSMEESERMVKEGDKWDKERVAKKILSDETIVSAESLRSLALDNVIEDDLRIMLMRMPEYEEIIPEVDESSELEVRYREIRYGIRIDGPGEFDNMGGELYLTVNGSNLLSDKAPVNSTGKTAEERKWAHNAYTDFSNCVDPKEFKKYCEEHKRAVLIMIENGEHYSRFWSFRERVEIIERILLERDTKHNEEEIRTAISEITLEEYNDTLTETRKGITDLVHEDNNDKEIQDDEEPNF